MSAVLFDRIPQPLTPPAAEAILTQLFSSVATRLGAAPQPGHVPVYVLEAYGKYDTHLRYLLEAAAARSCMRNREGKLLLRRIERALDALPDAIMETLPAGPTENWMLAYRQLLQLHQMFVELPVQLDTEEYTSVLNKMVELAACISRASAVEVNAASMFTLMLIQVHLHSTTPKPRKRTCRKAKRSRTGSKTPDRIKKTGTRA